MPFLGAPSKYIISASNITGGSPNLIVNGGVNNMALGNFVLTTHETGDNNIAIGNGAMADDLSGYNNVALGFNAKRSRINPDGTGSGSSSYDTVFVGNNAAGDPFCNYGNSVVIGSDAGNIPCGEINNDNVIIGHDAGYSESPLNATASRNVIIGASAAQDVNNQPQENVVIGAEAAINSTLKNNNVIIGRGAMQGGFDDIKSNVIIGDLASAKGANFDAVITQNVTVIGNNAAQGTNLGVNNIAIGDQAFSTYNEEGFYASLTPSTTNLVIGDFSARYLANESGNVINYNDNVILGHNTLNSSQTVNFDISNNVIIGNGVSRVVDGTLENAIIIGNNIEVANGSDFQIVIGDPLATYTSVIVGGVDLLAGGGGGFAAQATQSDLNDVSIISSAEDGISAFLAGYEFVSNTDNSTVATTNISFYAAGDNGSATTSGIYDESGSLEFNHELINGANTSNYTSALGVGNAEISIQSFDATTQGDVSLDASLNGATIAASSFDGTNTAAIGINAIISTTSLVYEVVAPTGYKHVWNVPDETGASAADFTIANAPAAIQITNWIKLTLNGVDGYVPFLSTPI
jgi:trimeric autotransporter adhesin